jgi:hypothetical protein
MLNQHNENKKKLIKKYHAGGKSVLYGGKGLSQNFLLTIFLTINVPPFRPSDEGRASVPWKIFKNFQNDPMGVLCGKSHWKIVKTLPW